jgi:gluconate 5-dehydrogenase
MALALAEAGSDLILIGRDSTSLEATADAIRDRGRVATTIVADAGVPADCERFCGEVLDRHGTVDILINNVGGRRVNIPTDQFPLETWQQMVDLNLTSVFLCTKLLGAAMLKRGTGGRIINIASISGMVANRKIGGRSYETAKGAVIQFTRAVASDWAPYGITVNAICPGGFMTDPNIRWSQQNPEVIEAFKEQIPMGDFGRPEDLGPLAVYLASDASRYMTGAALVIDGGYTLW